MGRHALGRQAEMVAAGVIPIDRLTDVRGPVEVVAQRIGRQQLESVYSIKLPRPSDHEDPTRCMSLGHSCAQC